MLTNPGTTPNFKPTLKEDQELWEILEITDLHFLRKANIIRNLNPSIKALVDNTDYKLLRACLRYRHR